ncbi:M23 family metallopeptidase [Candidatus Synchoanobacter obligatus]|uniref:M23 family metallopeptidase n=1 Tax=Candidatus Synchoanobacter obligatus TaxID=2919597 RepID=A0ABT1L5C5_9GAMM|nr:M23 family metallopeptidase [Candidatus Synchoanobacter obligatus]MCP8352294.1 M23 family metallopeptidase [Candidatus Synchoanobacter obligatus]
MLKQNLTNSLLLLTLMAWTQASVIHVTVQPGDTFNTILRKNGIASQSIDQINAQAKQLPLLSRLNPYDTIELTTHGPSQQLTSAIIYNKNQPYILSDNNHHYQIHPLAQDDTVSIVNSPTNETTQQPDKIRIQRLTAVLFPEQGGSITAAIKSGQIISLKLTSQTQTQYAFLAPNPSGITEYYDNHNQFIGHGFSRTPTQYKRISSPFNPKRIHPISKKTLPHKGVDLAAPINTPVWAAAQGTVIHKSSDTGYGNLLIIAHDNNIKTYYAHLNKFHKNLQVGHKVQAYETIGYVGSTGHSTGPHLHFELRINDTPLDPLTTEIPTPNQQTANHLEKNYYF